MPGLIPERFIDELLARIDIVDVVQSRVPLKRAGREWMACCPFHDERTPSFTVSPTKQFYHCFGCGAHGSALKFLMEFEHLEFPDAVEELAQSVGLAVPHEGGPARPREDHTDLYALLAAAAAFYQRALPDSAPGQAYCRKRGLDPDIIRRFGIGWAPGGWDALKRALGTSPERVKLLDEAGMLSRGDKGPYDRFRERLMFPIRDRRGRVIAFGGRIITSAANAHSADTAHGEGPKYLNSPETALFHKGRELFALWQAREANRKLERLIVVEGYMDVVALHQAGITQAVATLGTSTTAEHAELLFRAAPDVYFCFDGDKAGRSAAWRALESVLPTMRDGRRAWFLFLPEGEDPDTLIRKEHMAGFEARIQNAVALSDYFFEYMSRDMDFSSTNGKTRMAEYASLRLTKLPDSAFRDSMYDELWKKTWVRVSPKGIPIAPHQSWTSGDANRRRSLVRSTIAMLLADPSLAAGVEPPYAFASLDQPGVGLLVELMDLARARPGINTALLLEAFAARPEAAALDRLAMMEFPGEPEALRAEFSDAVRRLAERAAQQRRNALIRKQAEAGLDAAEKQELRALLARRAGTATGA